MNWLAKWIWDHGEAQPRNYWLCFTKKIVINEKYDEVKIRITGDSRYYLYVNERFEGHGPVRSWPFELSYDTYDIVHLLQQGVNVISVLIHHFGISTFQYIEGQGGLFAQIEFYKDGNCINIIGTDTSWKIHEHTGYARNNVRLSLQQAWAEIFDANNTEFGWISKDFDDSSWCNAKEVGNYGEGPWAKLKKRDIPFLTDELVYPVRVASVKDVVPIHQHLSIDFRDNFFPGEKDINWKGFTGIVGLSFYSPRNVKGKMVFRTYNHAPGLKYIKVNGREYSISSGVFIEVGLTEGDNLILIDVSGDHHELFLHMAFEFEQKICFSSPNNYKYEYFTIGPFIKETLGNYRDEYLNDFPEKGMEFEKAWNIKCSSDLQNLGEWVKPVPTEFVCRQNVFTLARYKNNVKKYQIKYPLNNMIIANNSCSQFDVPPNGDKEIIIDFGNEVSGYVEFELEAQKGAILDMYMFEQMDGDIVSYTDALNNFLRYISRGGRQVYRSLVRRGFRFIMIVLREYSLPVKVYKVMVHQSTYPVADVGRFECSDYQLNKIWEICKRTTRLCMEDTFVDCPAYEQVFWVGDCRNESLANYYQFGAYEIVKRCLNLVAASMQRSSVPESHVPSGWKNVIPAWSMLWMLACREYYEHTGDIKFLESIYPYLIKAVNGFKAHMNKDKLIEMQAWNMLDWADMDTPGSGIVTHQNALFVKALNDVSFIAQAIGKNGDIDALNKLEYAVRNAINNYLWSDEKQAYIDCIHADGKISSVVSQQTNIIVYLCDCAEGKRKLIIENYLLNLPKSFVKVNSAFMSFFYMETLLKYKKDEKMLQNIIDLIKKEWGLMLRNGSTTCWETFGRTRSHCHAWSTAPGFFLGAYILGVRPQKPGFEKVLIEPYICGLQWAKGSVPVPYGRIDVEWELVDGKFNLNISIPIDIEYDIILPSSISDSNVYINGERYK